jgi:pyruvate/2-oxoglutarate dehydrogenase complex dihydrolipoamide acyltransferase (E2) component
MLRNPYRAKRLTGTVMVTSVAMFGKTSAWAIPVGIHPLALGLGGIARKPGLVRDRVEPRDMLSLTIVFDHDVADGVPVALFVKRLVKLMESAYALGEENTCS